VLNIGSILIANSQHFYIGPGWGNGKTVKPRKRFSNHKKFRANSAVSRVNSC